MKKKADKPNVTINVNILSNIKLDGKSLICIIIAEYYGAAEPPVRCGESHLSGLTEPLRSL